MQELVTQVRAEHVPAVFGSEVFPSKVLEQVARESGARYVAEVPRRRPSGAARFPRAHLRRDARGRCPRHHQRPGRRPVTVGRGAHRTDLAAVTGAADPILEFEEAAFAYAGGTTVVEAHLRIPEGARVGLVGPSGSGKTTLLRAAIGQLRPVRGRVRLGGRPVGRRLPRRVGYVPQLETIDWNFPVTVAEVVLMGRAGESGPWPWASRSDRHVLDATLERLGIGELRTRHLRSLSGGQQQRVFLARALVRQPDLLLLDEPTAGLDVRTRQDILGLLEELNRSGITIVLTTHDLNGVAGLLPEVVCLNRRIIAQGPPQDVFTPQILRETFGSDILVFSHDGILVTADAPPHGPEHSHHLHLHHGPEHPDLHHGVEDRETAG